MVPTGITSMKNIRNLFSRKLLDCFARHHAGTIVRRKLEVERLEDRTNPAPMPSLSNIPNVGTFRAFIPDGSNSFLAPTNPDGSPFLDLGVDVGANVTDQGPPAPTIIGAGVPLELVGAINIGDQATYNNPFSGEKNISVPTCLGAGDRIYVYRMPAGSLTPGRTAGLTVNVPAGNESDSALRPVSLRPAFRNGMALPLASETGLSHLLAQPTSTPLHDLDIGANSPGENRAKVPYRRMLGKTAPTITIQAPASTPPVAPIIPATEPIAATAPAPADSLPATDAGLTDEQRQAIEHIVKDSTDKIWFEKNIGQYPEGVLYGFKTDFGAMLVYADHLRLISTQLDANGEYQGQQIVDIAFTGSNAEWTLVPGEASGVTGSYQQADGTTLQPDLFQELTLRNVYDGIDLRLYSVENGTLEFDWIVAKAQDYGKIRMSLTGQDGIAFNDDGSATIDLRYQDLTLRIPETYQVIDGVKHALTAKMVAGDSPNEIAYAITGDIVADQPLVIDPNVAWSTYFDLNTTTFDSYVFAVAANGNGVYVSGWAREQITTAAFGTYMQVPAGFSAGTATFQNYIYRLNTSGTSITAWTSTGITANNNGVSNQKLNGTGFDVAADLELFPDGRVLLGFNSGLLQIYSADLGSRLYSAEPVTMDTLNSVAIVDDNTFYASGRVSAAIPTTELAASNLGPDSTFGGTLEGVIIRYSNATTTPTVDWATYVGGDGDEYFTTVALTPDNTRLVFSTSTAVTATGGYSALVNAVDSSAGLAGTTELLVGVLANQATVPANFNVFSFLGGSGNEGTVATNTTVGIVAASNAQFWVAGNTASNDLTGVTTATGGTGDGSQTTNAGGSFDTFVSAIPLAGGGVTGFQSTYLGGTGEDNIGGIGYDPFKDRLLIFGTTNGGFPTLNTTPASNYFDGTSGGGLDIFITTLSGDLQIRDYSTYIGGTRNDYLGQTGDLVGQGQVFYSPVTDLTYLATTVHSQDLPTSVIGTAPDSPPGKDPLKETNTTSADTHIIIAFNINIFDYGDAPASYEGSPGDPAGESISSVLHLGTTVDAEFTAQSGTAATADDLNNTGAANDEDGIATLPVLNVGATTYSTTVSVLNTTGSAKTLQGWIDFNMDGVFQSTERATVSVPDNATQQTVTLTWSGLPPLTGGQAYLRLRLTDNVLTDNIATSIDERSIGIGGVGEVEDYALTIVSASVGDRIWYDINGNGTQEAVEPGIPGATVTVTWFGPNGVVGGGDDQVFTATTDANGNYTIPNLPVGNFSVAVSNLPNGLTTPTSGVGTFSLASGQNRTDVDFGFRGTGSIGDSVWLDLNDDGVKQAGEPGLAGVQVTGTWLGFDGVAGGSDDVNYTATTNASGVYSFTNLPAGNFSVTTNPATLPPGLVPTFDPDGTATPNTAGTTLAAGQARTDADFGYRGQAAIGDRVWYDVDGDGVQGNSNATGFEPGIAGATVTATFAGADGDLATNADNLTFTTVTDASGNYAFANIPGGTYRIAVTPPTGYTTPTFDADGTATPNASTLTVTATGTDLNQDFGLRGPATQGIGDRVWEDANGNGVQDPGEPGIQGVAVELLDANGGVLDRTATDANGNYAFPALTDSNAFGNYRIRFTTPNGYAFTTPNSPTATTATDSDADPATGLSAPVTLTANTTDNSVDAGMYRGLTIGDSVFYDLDGNGTQNGPNEGGLAGVTVNLYSAGADGVFDPADLLTPVATAITDANGNYAFPNRQPGLYRVILDPTTLPSGVTQATTPTSQDSTAASGTNDLARDFGFRGTGIVGDRVFLDLSNDGLSTPNEGLAGVTVRLVGDLNGDGVNETLTTTTGPDGFYQFNNVLTSAVGTPYTIRIDPATLPPAVTNTSDPDGGNDGTAAFNLTNAAPSNLTQDFGYRGTLSLGDRVWVDANGDGVQGPLASEPGLPGVTLRLTYAGPGGVFGDGDDLVTTTTTGANGVYNFTGLPPGNYRVNVAGSSLPTNVQQTFDLNGALDNSATRTLAVGQNATDVDFGYRGTASVGDSVWRDTNADGIRQANETGIPGATVTLQTAGADGTLGTADDITYAATTDANGNYLFPAVAVFNNSSPSRTTVSNVPAILSQVSDPDGTLDNTSAFTLGNTEIRNDQNYGYSGTGSISGTVYRDDNGDGVAQATEPRVAGVTLTLAGTDVFGNVVNLTTTTDGNGNYRFDRLTPGTYDVTESQPAGYLDGIDSPGTLGGNTTANDVIAGIPLALGQNGTGYTFGERGTTLSGYVFRDENRDGSRIGEPGIAGVQVQVFAAGSDSNLGTPDDVLVATTVTDGNGFYGFGNLIVPGPYHILETQPAGYGDSPATPALFRDVVLPPNGLTEQNFGETLGTISGTVYLDANSNNSLDAGDGRIANVLVTLTGNDVTGAAVFRTAVSDANGNYTFTNLLQSDTNGYILVETQPTPPYTPGAANVGTITGTVTGVAVSDGNTIAGVVIPAGQNAINYNFGELTTPNTTFIAGSVYLDTNRDGARQTGETGIAGITITLLDPNGTVIATTTTSSDGNYLFEGLTPGASYTILETQPDTLGDSPAGPTRSITIASLSADGSSGLIFGETLGSISGSVYFDANNNGVRDTGEAGIAGAAVSLTGVLPNGSLVPPSISLTDANGNYAFTNLAAGTYTLSESTPSPYTDGTDSIGNAGGVVGNDIVTQLPLSGGQNAAGYDFGEIGVPLSGTAFYDRNRDGAQDSSETTIRGVTIQLIDASGNVVATTTTDGTGNYRFPNVAPGNYTLRELQPVGYGDPTSGPFAPNTRPIAVADTPISGESFGDTLSTLGGFVYVDGNTNGIFDPGETPIPNTPVLLTGTDIAGNTINRIGFTDASGRYLFTDLPAGTYNLTETQPPPYLDGSDTPGIPGGGNTSVNDTISGIPLGAGVDFSNYNFAETQPASVFISGSVYLDRNNNGNRDTIDGSVAGVTLTLTNTTTGAVTTTTTDANGNYLFDNLVAGDNYTITETQPALWGNGLENTSNTVTVNNLSASGITGANFGEVPGSVSGNVYFDRDNSGTFNAGDSLISGVQIALGGAFPNGGGVFVNTTVTDASGFYQFTDLPAASYTITETQPTGYTQGVNTAGTQGASVNGDTIGSFDLPPGGTASGNLFGERAATVSGRVFNDVNRDGIPSIGSGIGGVQVQLVDSTNVVIATTTTGPDGTYSFINVLPGNYTIVETQPAVFGNSPVGPATVQNVTVTETGLADQNFGEALARLSGTVFVDFNNNGIQDPGETGVANAAVSLTGIDVLGNLIPPSIILTDANGNYTFTELRAGSYTLSETQPAAWGDGVDSQGTAGGVPTNDLISNIPLSAGVTATGYNFAEVGGVIGGFVFEDSDNDGLQSPIEAGINGVIITLTGTSVDGTSINAIASTDPNGFFEFRNLPAGTYTLTEEQPGGYLDGTDTVSIVGGGTQGQDPIGNDQITAMTLQAGGIANDYAFGELLPSSITGSVFVDQNRNGVRDPFETGINGVTVTLAGTDDLGNPVNLTQTTGANGTYSFLNLRPGTYTIRETQPTGYSQSGNQVGSAGGVLAPVDQIQAIVLAPDQIGAGYNFGEVLQPAVVPPITVPPGTGPAFLRPTKRAFLGSSPTGGSVQSLPTFVNLRPADPLAPSNLLATGDGPGGQNLRVIDITTGTERINTTPFPTSTGGLRTAVGDVTGDSVQDVVVATGPGSDSTVNIYNGNTGALQSSFLAFEPAWRGGVFLATGDFNNDGREDIVVSRDAGGTAQVRIFSGADTSVTLADFNALNDPNFTGGVRIAVGDVNNDGRVDLVATGGPGGPARVLVWNGTTLVPNAVPTQLIGEFLAFPNTFTGGAYVAVGDTNGDGYGDIIVSRDAGSAPEVRVIDGRSLVVNNTPTVNATFNAFDPAFTGGVRVAAIDTNNDGISEIVAGSGPGQLELVRFYTATGVLLDTYSANYQGNKGGVYVGA